MTTAVAAPVRAPGLGRVAAGVHHASHASSLMWLGLVLVLAQLSLAGVAAVRR